MAKSPTNISPPMFATIQAWKILLNYLIGDTPSKSIPLSISSLQFLIPNLRIKHWISKGITNVMDIKVGPATKTFRN